MILAWVFETPGSVARAMSCSSLRPIVNVPADKSHDRPAAVPVMHAS
jgi:hypothetical protein